MGAVFGIVLGSIFAFFASFFTPFFGALTGTDSAQVILPYDENKGIVWEFSANGRSCAPPVAHNKIVS